MIWHSSSTEEVLKHFNVDDKKGISNSKFETELEAYGQNVISNIEKPTLLTHFFNQFKSKTVIVLIITALISFFLSFAYNEVNSFSALLIILIVVLNALISAYHIYSCNKTL